MTQEEKARAFDEIMEDAYSLDDKPHRLFLTLLRYADGVPGEGNIEDNLVHCYTNAYKLLDRP